MGLAETESVVWSQDEFTKPANDRWPDTRVPVRAENHFCVSLELFCRSSDQLIALFRNPPRLDKFQIESSPRVHEDGRSR